MKKYALTLLIGSLLLITGCSEKDAEYYQNNPEAAKEKIQACKDSLRDAKDKETFDKLMNDKECRAADQALKAIRKAAREAEEAAIERDNKAILATAEKALMKEHGNLDWKGFQKLYRASECQSYFSFSKKISSEDAKCVVMKQHYEKLIGDAKNGFANTPYSELITKEKELCLLDKGRLSPCSVWQDSLAESAKNSFKDTAYETLFVERDHYCEVQSEFKYQFCAAYEQVLNEKKEVVINNYAQNDTLFTDEYNKCYQKSLTTKSKSYLDGGQVLAKEDPICHAVNQAVNRRKLYELGSFKVPFNN